MFKNEEYPTNSKKIGRFQKTKQNVSDDDGKGSTRLEMLAFLVPGKLNARLKVNSTLVLGPSPIF